MTLSPLMLPVAAAVKLSSPGPVFFRQERIGYKGRVFRITKFRSMTVPSEEENRLGLHRSDPRITRIGAILRKYRIDELPQLLNVVLGDMSLVGPRPLLPAYVEQWTERERQRLLMPPGITGLQQISGGEKTGWEGRIELDLWYIANWTFWLDAKILLMTPLAVLRADSEVDDDGWRRSGIPSRVIDDGLPSAGIAEPPKD